MAERRIEQDLVSFNAVLDAAGKQPPGGELFHTALMAGVYPGLCRKGPGVLDLHDLSAGAAIHAVNWWLKASSTVNANASQLVIIVGQPSSRKHTWQHSG